MDNSKIIDELNTLLTKNYDAEKGYQHVSEKANTAALRIFFRQKARMRNYFGHELKTLIKELGGEPQKGGSFKGDLHRTWIDVKTVFAGNTEEAMLKEVERGEEAFISDYKDFLNDVENLPANVRQTVLRQKTIVEHTIEKVEEFEAILDN